MNSWDNLAVQCEKLHVKDGDTLLITVPYGRTKEELQEYTQQVRSALSPGIRCIFRTANVSVDVISNTEEQES